VRIGNAEALCKRVASGERWDMVFNVAEGLRGRFRESQVPCILEVYRIPYTFSDPFVCAITLDKSVAKHIVHTAGLTTPPFAVVKHASDLPGVRLGYPLFAKPLAEGTGKGIDSKSRVDTPEELADVCQDLLARYSQPVLVEEFLPGREFTVGILGTGPKARVLGSMEIVVRKAEDRGIYSYETKERCESLIDYLPVASGPLRDRVEALALSAHVLLECRDAGRADIRLDRHGEPAFMEINPLPGLHPSHSDLPMIATQEGMNHAELIGSIINSAAERV
jgi:D-alanine-D-alanine ligase